MLTNMGTPMNAHGWGLVLQELRRLDLAVSGGSNDLNADANSTEQTTTGDQTEPAVNAEYLQGIPISPVPPTAATPNMTFDPATGMWTPTAAASTSAASAILLNAIGISQNLSATTQTLWTFSSKDIDTDSAFDLATETFTVPTTGNYFIAASGTADDTAFFYLLLTVYKNGAPTAVNSDGEQAVFNGTFYVANAQVYRLMPLTAGDTITMYAYVSAAAGTVAFYNKSLSIMSFT